MPIYSSSLGFIVMYTSDFDMLYLEIYTNLYKATEPESGYCFNILFTCMCMAF